MNAIIESLGVYLPPRVLTTQDVLDGCRQRIRFPLERFTGIRSRRAIGEGESSFVLAKKAAEKCFSMSKYDPCDIDLIVNCSISHSEDTTRITFEPCIAQRLVEHFRFPAALAFDILSACTGMFTGILATRAFLRAGIIRRGMVVSGAYLTHLIDTAQKEIESFMDPRLSCLTVGDAGAALILEESQDEAAGFHELELFTLGKYGRHCMAKLTDREHGGSIMYNDPVKLTEVSIKNGGHHAWSLFRNSGIPVESFDHLIIHQTSRMTIQNVMDEINKQLNGHYFDDENTINNLSDRGNTASTAHFVAVNDNILNRRINSGDRVIFGISGSGQTLGTALYTFDDLPDRLRRAESTDRIHGAAKSGEQRSVVIRPPSSGRIVIESVETCMPDETTERDCVALATAAAAACLKQSSVPRDHLDLILYAGVYRNDILFEPAIAALIAGNLDINAESFGERRTLAFDVFNGAVGFTSALMVACQMIDSGSCNNVLVATSDVEICDGIRIEGSIGLQAMGSAVILAGSSDHRVGFGHTVLRNLPESEPAYRVHGEWRDKKGYIEAFRHENLDSMYLDAIPGVVQEILTHEGLSLSEVDHILPPQFPPSFIAHLGQSLDLPRDTFIEVVNNGKDPFTSAIPSVLQYGYRQNRFSPGDIGLFISVGAGLQVGCTIYYF